jgi:fructose transport system permease protein
MSTPTQSSSDAESGLIDSTTDAVAEFDEDKKTLLQRIQHFLHGNPAMVPVIILIVSVIAFRIVAGAMSSVISHTFPWPSLHVI